MKKIVIGILAHVDAGKTTLSEALLYSCGATKNLGRVDKKNAFLDNFTLERERGITIFSKQAEFVWKDMGITLLDTPGHTDFSAEMERVLKVLDYAVLVVSGADGVQGHTKTLWTLLKRYNIPVFVFVNKMDQNGTDRVELLTQMKGQLGDNVTAFDGELKDTSEFFEEIAAFYEPAMEYYLDNDELTDEILAEMIEKRLIVPCYFGSALKLSGVENLLEGIYRYSVQKDYKNEFGAKVFKISRDDSGNRLTHLKVTGGCLKVKDIIDDSSEKINQIRLYSGEKFVAVKEITAGNICTVTGLSKTFAGQSLGMDADKDEKMLEPVLAYRIILPEGMDSAQMLPKIKELEEEDPTLSVSWQEEIKEIQVKIMGEIQLQVIKSMVKERFNIDIDFDQGNVVYKETIEEPVLGSGHFEPLRHFAEVHLKLEPGERGSGLQFDAECSEDILAKNWQRLIMTHLAERRHKGVLTGAFITDMKITLIGGKAHLKHTEGGDFRQATYRALRQGLKKAKSVLLEPYYDFCLNIPYSMLGKAMTDMERVYGHIDYHEVNGDFASVYGYGPVITLREYQKDVMAYTRGMGNITCVFKGYYPCHNSDEIIEKTGYDSEQDMRNPTGSVFCAHGAGFYVPYDEVDKYMHLSFELSDGQVRSEGGEIITPQYEAKNSSEEIWLGVEEIDDILAKTYNSNKKDKGSPGRNKWKKTYNESDYFNYKPSSSVKYEKKESYLLVDGYNVIFAWEDLKELAEVNIDGARGKLLDCLCNYQAIKKCNLIVVFDAYRVKGHDTEILDYHNIHVVYTREAETADQYIEKFAHNNSKKYDVTVATSDGLEQIIIRGEGARLISSRELKDEVENAGKRIMEEFEAKKEEMHNYLLEDREENQND